jgi:hypothetical protein
MTRDDMMKLLHECGYDTLMDDPIMKPLALRRAENMMRFAALVAAAEREACAKICEEATLKNWFAEDCVALIRARGEV